MVEVDFSDVDAAEAWFEGQTPEIRCTMASRAALRVTANLGLYDRENIDSFILSALRCSFTSAVRGVGRTSNMERLGRAARSAESSTYLTRLAVTGTATEFATRSAEFAALSVLNSDHSAARSAAQSVGFSSLSIASSAVRSAIHSARSAALFAAAWDSQHLDDNLASQSLWAGWTKPDVIQAQHTTFLSKLRTKPDWDFFRSWYEQMWKGTFTDWDLATEVAKIDDDVWDEGLASVAKAIRGIEARRRTQVSVPIVRNQTDTAFELAIEDPLPDELLQYIKERVGGALRTALDSGGNNGFDDDCPEAIAVVQALQSSNPSAVAGLLNDASLMFQTNLGDIYPNNGALIRLQAAAFSGAEEICEIDELARKRCLRASQLFLRENPEPIDPVELEDFTEIIASKATGQAAEIIRSDGRALASGKRVGRFIRARYANYSTTIVEWIDKTKKGAARIEWMWKMAKKLLDRFQDPPD